MLIYSIVLLGMVASYSLGWYFGQKVLPVKKKRSDTIPVPEYYDYFADGEINSPEELILFTQEHASELYLSLCSKLRHESDEADVQR